MIGHFTAMVHMKNVAVACALIKFRRHSDGHIYFEVYLVCNYSYTNLLGEAIYTPVKNGARPGSGCQTGTDDVYKGLCKNSENILSAPDAYMPKYTKENPTSMSPQGPKRQQSFTQDTPKYTGSGWTQVPNVSAGPLGMTWPLQDIRSASRYSGTGRTPAGTMNVDPLGMRIERLSTQFKTNVPRNTGTGWTQAQSNPPGVGMKRAQQITQEITYVTPDGRVFHNKNDLDRLNIRSYSTHTKTTTRTLYASP